MVSIASMPSTTSVMSAYTAFVASAMFFQTIIREIQNLIRQIIPQKLQEKFVSFLEGFFGSLSSQMTLVIEETNGLTTNEIYHASEIYLGTRITPSIGQLKVYKDPRENGISLTIDKGQKVLDVFDGINLVWQSVHKESTNQTSGYVVTAGGQPKSRKNSVERLIKLSFEKQHMGTVVNAYLPYVLERAKAIKTEKKVVKLHTLGHNGEVNLNHPSTFETLAMDPDVKQDLKDDLDRFLKRKDLYRKVGKPWKRGYLLYGPPGTGKSSLIAAMANYLKFDIYDLELSGLRSNNGLKSMMSNTKNRSILVIEDIDCSAEMPTRQSVGQSQLTLSGLLNFIDGLWSSCGDERIIVFTTNYKERLDPALLRPGRMDMHIHMSYCTSSGFRTLASNYHSIKSHRLFDKIDQLITEVEVTPAEIAEELLKSEDADTALQGLIRFLLKKKEMKYEQPDTSKQSKETDKNATENEREIQGKGDKLQKSSVLSRDGSLFGVSYLDNH